MTRMTTRPRKHILVPALFAVAALSLAGCGRSETPAPDETPESSPSESTDEPAEAGGTLEIWATGGEGVELHQVVDGFNAAYPDVNVEITQVPADQFEPKMSSAIAASTVPDLIYSFSEFEPALIATGAFDPVPDGVVDQDAFFDNIWDISVVDGVTYGVPWYAYARATMLNKPLLDQAGIEAPTNWDENLAYAAKMKDLGVEFPVKLDASYSVYTAWELDILAHQNGGSLINEDQTEWTIDTPENLEALKYWGSYFDQGYSSPDGPLLLDTVAWFTKGDTAEIFEMGPFIFTWFADANGEEWVPENILYVPNPAGPSGDLAAGVGGAAWMVPSDADNKDAAWAFVSYMSEPETQLEWYQIFNGLPAVEEAWDDSIIAGNAMLDAVRVSLGFGVPNPNVPTWNEVGDMLGREMEKVARGTATPEEVLAAAQAKAESIGVGR